MLPTKKLLGPVLLFACVVMSPVPLHAEDTEIYFIAGEGGGANVLLVIDTSAATHRTFKGTTFSEGGKTLDEISYALQLVVDGLADVTRIGVSSQLSGGGEGGAVNYPVKQINESRPPVARARVSGPEGEAQEFVKVPSVPLATNDGSISWSGLDLSNTLKLPSILSTGAEERVMGLLLPEVKVPRYAKIDRALLTLKTPSANQGATDSFGLRIAHEMVSEPASFTAASDFSARNWSLPFDNGGGSYNAKGSLNAGVITIDVTDVVQAAVADPLWCGGKNLSMLIQGTSVPEANAPEVYSFRAEDASGTRLGITQLEVEWSGTASVPPPGGVTGDAAKSCMSGSILAISDVNDDGVEASGGVNLATDGSTLQIRNITAGPKKNQGDYVAGVRFANVGLPTGTTVGYATMKGRIISATGSPATLRIRPMLGNTPPFTSAGSITSRPVGANTATVNAVPGPFSVDVTALVQEVFDSAGWGAGGGMGFRLDRAAGSSIEVHAVDGGVASGVVVEVGLLAPSPTDFVSTINRRDEMKTAIQKFSDSSGGGNNKPVTAYVEAAQYMLGRKPYWGAAEGHPEAFTDGGRSEYLSPMEQYDQCGGNHIILVTHAESSGESFKSAVDELTGTGECPSSANGDAWTCSAAVARFLQDAGANGLNVPITTHTVAFAPAQEDTVLGLAEVATAGGGEDYQSEDALELAQVLSKLIDRLTAEDASMAAPGVAVNQLNRFQHLDQLYYGVFKPATSTRWEGNLKRYRIDFGDGTTTAAIVDETGSPAVDPNTGFFKETSDSWWGSAPDGQDVALGGAREELESKVRNLLVATTSPAPGTSTTTTSKPAGLALTPVDGIEDISAAALGMPAGSTPEQIQDRLDLLLYGWGDPLHSEPRLVNFGYSGDLSSAIANPDLQDNTVFVATNHGMLHAIDAATGEEVFTFMPAEELAKTEARFQDVKITGPDFKRHTYGLDGGITVWRKSDGGSGVERVILYVAQRRGGNSYYALEVTDRANPKLLWRIQGGTGNYTRLGQTWSTPTLAQIMLNGAKVPVLIFGGGYSENDHDTRGSVSGADSVGNAIYIVNAFSGAVIWSASNTTGTMTNSDMKWSIPSQISAVDINFDAITDYLYASDLGGQVFRVDLNEANTGAADLAFRVKTVARVGTSESTGISNHRRFFGAPTLALIERNGEPTIQVVIGSGYRAHPLDEQTTDRIFAFDDTEALAALDSGATITSTIKTADLLDVTNLTTVDESLLNGKRGWYITLEKGEKVVSAAAVVSGKIYITSFLPDGQSVNKCSRVIGTGRLYVLNTADGSGAADGKRVMDLNLPGLPPQAQVIIGRTNSEGGGDPTTVAIVGTAVGTSEGLEGSGLRRIRWYEVPGSEEADQVLIEAGATLP